MKQMLVTGILLFTISIGNSLYGTRLNGSDTSFSALTQQDTLKENQSLYSGKVWTNIIHRINGDQFLFANYFLPGSVSVNGKTFRNIMIRYDIYSDEIMIPASRDEILQLNKEMIDSFSIIFENRVYKFSNIRQGHLKGINGIQGYFYVLYKNNSALYIRYKKDILPYITDKSDGSFMETQKIYFVNSHIIYPIFSINDLYKVLDTDEAQIRNWLKANNLKPSMKRPESFIPVIRFYESLRH